MITPSLLLIFDIVQFAKIIKQLKTRTYEY